MSKYYLFQDTKKCIGCNTCTIQCKSQKRLPIGPKISQIIQVGPKMVGGLPRATYVFMPCFHCEDPWCVAACPTGAIFKSDRGVVVVDARKCDGCGQCVEACPYDAIDLGMEPEIEEAEFHAVIWATGCSHVVSVFARDLCLTELISMPGQLLPKRGLIERFRFRGRKNLLLKRKLFLMCSVLKAPMYVRSVKT